MKEIAMTCSLAGGTVSGDWRTLGVEPNEKWPLKFITPNSSVLRLNN